MFIAIWLPTGLPYNFKPWAVLLLLCLFSPIYIYINWGDCYAVRPAMALLIRPSRELHVMAPVDLSFFISWQPISMCILLHTVKLNSWFIVFSLSWTTLHQSELAYLCLFSVLKNMVTTHVLNHLNNLIWHWCVSPRRSTALVSTRATHTRLSIKSQ